MDKLDPMTGERMSFARRVKRALARRFPRTRRAYNHLRAVVTHGPRRLLRTRRTAAWLREVARRILARRREERLTVGVDVTAFWEPLTGIGWYLYRLLEHLAERPDVRLRLYGTTCVESPDLAGPVVALPGGRAIETVSYEVPHDLLLPAGLLIRLLRRLEPLLIAADGNEVIFAPNYFLPRRYLLCRGRRVATIHDLGFRQVPWTLRHETLAELTDRLEHAVFEAARLVSVSESVRGELAAFRYASPQRVTAVHHGPGQLAAVEPTRLPEGTPERFALHVGTLEPRKNILLLLEAWRTLRARRPDAPALVLCGRFGWKAEAIQQQARVAQRQGWLHHAGYVEEGELAALYRHAQMVVFPSIYEGFGLPALEALYAGAPLVCNNLPVLHEVAGDAALYADASRPAALANAVERLLDEPELRAELVERGRRRVETFSWHRAAERTLTVWREAAGRAA